MSEAKKIIVGVAGGIFGIAVLFALVVIIVGKGDDPSPLPQAIPAQQPKPIPAPPAPIQVKLQALLAEQPPHRVVAPKESINPVHQSGRARAAVADKPPGHPTDQEQDRKKDRPVRADDAAKSRVDAASVTTKPPATVPTQDPFSPFPLGAEYPPGTTVRLQSQYRVCGAGPLKYGQVVEGVLLPNGLEGTLIRMRTDSDRFESWCVGIIHIDKKTYQVDADDFVAVEPQPAPKKVQPGSKLTQAQRDAQIQKNLAKNRQH